MLDFLKDNKCIFSIPQHSSVQAHTHRFHLSNLISSSVCPCVLNKSSSSLLMWSALQQRCGQCPHLHLKSSKIRQRCLIDAPKPFLRSREAESWHWRLIFWGCFSSEPVTEPSGAGSVGRLNFKSLPWNVVSNNPAWGSVGAMAQGGVV